MKTTASSAVQIEAVTVAHGETGLESAHDGDVKLAVVITRQLTQFLDGIDSIEDLRAARALVRRSLLNAEIECDARGIVAPNIRAVAFKSRVH